MAGDLGGDLSVEVRGGVSAVLFLGSTDLRPHRKWLGAPVWRWGRQRWGGEGRMCSQYLNSMAECEK